MTAATIPCCWTCPRCSTTAVGETSDGATVKCPSCGIFFTSRIEWPEEAEIS